MPEEIKSEEQSQTENPSPNGNIAGKDPTTGKFLPGNKLSKGRAEGSKNFDTLFRMALESYARKVNLTANELEIMLVEVGIAQAIGGEFNFHKDLLDRVHGKPNITLDINSKKPMEDEEEKKAEIINLLEKLDANPKEINPGVKEPASRESESHPEGSIQKQD